MTRLICSLVGLSIVFAGALRDASATPELQRAAILTTVAEAAVASASLIYDVTGEDGGQEISWEFSYSDRDWTFEGQGVAGGQDIRFVMNGYLWGQDGESWVIGYSGLGQLGEDEVRIHGKADWVYDEQASDYTKIDFRQVMKFGENSVWGWVLGAETLFGGAIGAGAAVATSAVATGGAAVGAAPWIAAGGALAGSTALIGASAAAKSLLESDEPVSAPDAPVRPDPPAAGTELLPGKGTMLTAVSYDGGIMASGPDGRQLLIGQSKWNGTVGVANGGISTLPQ